MMRRTRAVTAVSMLAASMQAMACPPPAVFVPWPEKVARAYGQSQAVFVASVVREQVLRGNGDHESLRAFLKPIRFFKGGDPEAPRHIDKRLKDTCDQRPFARVGSQVLVFASAQGELLRVTPEQDLDNSPAAMLMN